MESRVGGKGGKTVIERERERERESVRATEGGGPTPTPIMLPVCHGAYLLPDFSRPSLICVKFQRRGHLHTRMANEASRKFPLCSVAELFNNLVSLCQPLPIALFYGRSVHFIANFFF
jgi:hypothetical protein